MIGWPFILKDVSHKEILSDKEIINDYINICLYSGINVMSIHKIECTWKCEIYYNGYGVVDQFIISKYLIKRICDKYNVNFIYDFRCACKITVNEEIRNVNILVSRSYIRQFIFFNLYSLLLGLFYTHSLIFIVPFLLNHHELLSFHILTCNYIHKIHTATMDIGIPDYRVVSSFHIAVYKRYYLSALQIIDR